MSKCKACGAEIWWIRTENGKDMPVNEQPIPFVPGAGPRTYITEEGRTMRGRDWRTRDPYRYELGYVPHWVTCPKADSFRKGRK
jgi:hypothetical protein